MTKPRRPLGPGPARGVVEEELEGVVRPRAATVAERAAVAIEGQEPEEDGPAAAPAPVVRSSDRRPLGPGGTAGAMERR